jgi:phytoene synthase
MVDFKAARQFTRRHAKTFYFASWLLSAKKREAAYVIYTFCRHADDVLDETADLSPADRIVRLDRLHSELEKAYAAEGPLDEFAPFREIVRRYGIPHEYFAELLEGVAMDLKFTRYRTWPELEIYCYRVASVVGLIMAHVFGVSDPRAYAHAAELGKAMQLTNILRDVREDYEMGRIYLPGEDLARFGCAEEDLARGTVTDGIRELLRFEIARARALYRSAAAGIPYLVDGGSRFCVKVMSALYERILDVIERNGYDVFSERATVPFREKLFHTMKLKLS